MYVEGRSTNDLKMQIHVDPLPPVEKFSFVVFTRRSALIINWSTQRADLMRLTLLIWLTWRCRSVNELYEPILYRDDNEWKWSLAWPRRRQRLQRLWTCWLRPLFVYSFDLFMTSSHRRWFLCSCAEPDRKYHHSVVNNFLIASLENENMLTFH